MGADRVIVYSRGQMWCEGLPMANSVLWGKTPLMFIRSSRLGKPYHLEFVDLVRFNSQGKICSDKKSSLTADIVSITSNTTRVSRVRRWRSQGIYLPLRKHRMRHNQVSLQDHGSLSRCKGGPVLRLSKS